jgi:MFS family permease
MDGRDEGRGTFWNRDFVVALFGYLFLYMAVSMFFLLPLFLGGFGPSKGRVGLIMGVHSVLAILARPVFGRMIDLRGGRRFALTGIVVLAATVPLFHLVRDAGAFPLLLRAVSGVGWGIGMTATIAVCSDLAPAASLARSMGIIGVAGLVANALGPLLAEELIRRFGFGAMFDAALAFLAAAFACMFLTREASRGMRREPSRAEPGPLRNVPAAALLVISAMPVFHGAVRGTMIYFVALFGTSIGIARVGPFFLAFSLAAILTRFSIADLSDRYGRKRIVFLAAVIIGLNLFVLSRVRSFGPLVLTGFVGGLGQGLIFPALSTYIIDCLGRKNKGLAISLYLSLFDVGMGLGAPLFGWVSDRAGYRTMYVFAGLLLLAATAVFMAGAPKTETDTSCDDSAGLRRSRKRRMLGSSDRGGRK